MYIYIYHFRFTNLTENHRNACKMASNRLQPGTNAQCPPMLMRAHRFELSTEVLKFYRRSKSSTEELHFYGTATAYSTEELDFFGRISRLFTYNSYISKERLQIYLQGTMAEF